MSSNHPEGCPAGWFALSPETKGAASLPPLDW